MQLTELNSLFPTLLQLIVLLLIFWRLPHSVAGAYNKMTEVVARPYERLVDEKIAGLAGTLENNEANNRKQFEEIKFGLLTVTNTVSTLEHQFRLNQSGNVWSPARYENQATGGQGGTSPNVGPTGSV